MANGTDSADKRTRILEAVTGLIQERGLQALSFEAVAAQSDLSRQLVRYYYPTLDHLIAELCDHMARGYRDALVAGIVQVREVERLDFFLDYFFDLADGHPMPDNLAAYDSLLAYAVGSKDLRDRLCVQYKTLGDVITHELAIAHKDLSARACEELSFIFVSMMHAHWSFVASLGYDRAHSHLTRNAIRRLINSYRADASPSMDRAWTRTG